MKIKQQLIIANSDEFMRGDYSACFTLLEHETTIGGWINCGEIEIEVNVNKTKTLAANSIRQLKKQIRSAEESLKLIKQGLSNEA